jgi:hypothetical protein
MLLGELEAIAHRGLSSRDIGTIRVALESICERIQGAREYAPLTRVDEAALASVFDGAGWEDMV